MCIPFRICRFAAHKERPFKSSVAYTSSSIVSNHDFAETTGIVSGTRKSGRIARAQHPQTQTPAESHLHRSEDVAQILPRLHAEIVEQCQVPD